MPLVWIRRNPKKITDARIEHLLDHLPEIIVGGLSLPDKPMRKTSVVIAVHDIGPFDRNMSDVNIVIFAHSYKWRLDLFDEIRARICREVVLHLGERQSWALDIVLGQFSYASGIAGVNES